MAKSRRLMADQLKKADLVIEVCDARLPHSSRNPELKKMIRGKKHLLLINKSDLAEEGLNRAWLSLFRRGGETATLLNGLKLNRKDILNLIQRETADLVEKAKARGVRKTVRAMVVGVPNVGKSTVINHLRGGNIAVTGDRPGVTRASQMIRVTPYLELMDTPGLLWPRLDDQEAARRLCYIGAVSDEVVDLYALAASLMEELKAAAPEKLAERYHLTDLIGTGHDLLEEACRGRGWLLKGNEVDLDRCCRVILDEFRGGKIGRITLEKPEDSESRKEAEAAPSAADPEGAE